MKAAILGCGVVGGGVADILLRNGDVIKQHTGINIELKYILDIRDFGECEYTPYLTKSVDDIISDSEVELVAECMGGIEPAFTFVSRALCAGKHVATSNKQLVAEKGDVLLDLAREHNVNFMFEASVGGGIPIIRPITRCLAANRITEVAGILNGTTNFILQKMFDETMPFADALKLAQQLGYAEKDPTADIEGHDACRKICILASLCFGFHVFPDGVCTEGVRSISLDDVKAADKAGFCIKLIADAKLTENGKVKILVSPAAVSKSSLLSAVNGVVNACLVRGDMIGEAAFTGPGAGKEATASAVVADLIDMAEHSKNRKFFGWGKAEPERIESIENTADRYIIRIGGEAYTSEKLTPAQVKEKCAAENASSAIRIFE